jgi:glycosyltransferase A (GT-A) superfamily protein (DUF2064 family)
MFQISQQEHPAGFDHPSKPAGRLFKQDKKRARQNGISTYTVLPLSLLDTPDDHTLRLATSRESGLIFYRK